VFHNLGGLFMSVYDEREGVQQPWMGVSVCMCLCVMREEGV